MKINGNLLFQGGGAIQNARIENLAIDPLAPAVGQIWFNTTENLFKGFDGTNVKPLGTDLTAAKQTEMDATQVGAGLATDGAYVVPTSSNYLAAATSLADADIKLDTAVKGVVDALAAETAARLAAGSTAAGDLSAALAQEVTDRNAAVAAETAARVAADAAAAAAASDQLATETTARIAGDTALGGRIDGVQSELDATQASVGLNTDGTYTAPESTTFLGTSTSIKDAAVKLDAALTAEAAARAAADTAFQTALAAEATTRAAADSNFQSQIDTLVSELTGETGVTGELAGEIAARTAADTAIKTELDTTQASIGLAEDGTFTAITGSNYLGAAATVLGAVTVLDTQIKATADAIAAETAARSTADTNFNTSLNTEVAARTAADTAQQTEIDTIEAGAGLETDGTYASPTGSNYINTATSLKDADYKLDAAVKVVADGVATNATAIADETTARVAAITSAISGEVTARDAAITSAIATEVTARDAAITAGLATIAGGGYYLYTSSASAATHVVLHNLGSKFATVTVVDADDNVIIPQGVKFDSATQLTVTFNTAIDCKVVISGLRV